VNRYERKLLLEVYKRRQQAGVDVWGQYEILRTFGEDNPLYDDMDISSPDGLKPSSKRNRPRPYSKAFTALKGKGYIFERDGKVCLNETGLETALSLAKSWHSKLFGHPAFIGTVSGAISGAIGGTIAAWFSK
jgi:hypothetical protein